MTALAADLQRSVSRPRGAAYTVRGALAREGEMVSGWCWAPERGHERLRVSLLIDGQRVGGAVAARLRGDLVRDGVCDGYHGFSLPLPNPLPPYAVIEAQETATRQVFGRLLSPRGTDIGAWDARTRTSAAHIASLHRRAAPPLGRSVRSLVAHCAELGVGTSEGARVPAGLSLPALDRPALSVLLHAGTAAQAALGPAIMSFAPLLRHFGAELILAEAGHHASGSTLAAIDGLIYLRCAGASEAVRLNAAAARARAPRLLIFRAEDGQAGEIAPVMQIARARHNVLLGERAAALMRSGFRQRPVMSDDTQPLPGLTLSVGRDNFAAAGGLDPAFCESADWAALDFALRAHRKGDEIVSCRPGSPAYRETGCGEMPMHQRFAARWDCAPVPA